ncbi:hypothetical protein TNCT1_55070 [Streptomyces sp. 1-11]|nr:hypothetical protein TNCT1_55070 [Streptomyces sp. 1-11]
MTAVDRGPRGAGSSGPRRWWFIAAGYPAAMKALVINRTLERSPDASGTEALAGVVVTGDEDGRTM